jgi:RNase H-fold protein (predicted Holliday junction resolvase)
MKDKATNSGEGNPTEFLMAVDPGRGKCGVAVADAGGKIVHRQIVPTADLEEGMLEIFNRFSPSKVLLGCGTFSGEVRKKLENLRRDFEFEFLMVDEKHSTEKARILYFRKNPPRGLWKLVPLGLRVPPGPYDDFAAQVLVEEYLTGGEDDV